MARWRAASRSGLLVLLLTSAACRWDWASIEPVDDASPIDAHAGHDGGGVLDVSTPDAQGIDAPRCAPTGTSCRDPEECCSRYCVSDPGMRPVCGNPVPPGPDVLVCLPRGAECGAAVGRCCEELECQRVDPARMIYVCQLPVADAGSCLGVGSECTKQSQCCTRYAIRDMMSGRIVCALPPGDSGTPCAGRGSPCMLDDACCTRRCGPTRMCD